MSGLRRGAGTFVACALATASITVGVAGAGETRRGVKVLRDGAFDGYTLVAPSESTSTYLVDLEGRVVNEWESELRAGMSAYLLEGGRLLRAGKTERSNPFEDGSGRGGVIEAFDWDGNLTWRFDVADERMGQHHDIEPLPNGNVLVLAWDRKRGDEARAAGRDPDLLPDDELWSEMLLEVDPRTDRVVWEWRAWDHLVQDQDPDKPDFGVVSHHPERIDVNYVTDNGNKDWMHANSVNYHPDLDQIVVSLRSFHEIWIIDHATTTEEARGPRGDLLFRWGNPASHGAGLVAPRELFAQHDAEWIAPGLDGEGRISIFDNGTSRHRPYSRIIEIAPALEGRDYVLGPDGVHVAEITRVVWPAEPDPDFFAHHTSGAQRLPNGNSLLTDGPRGEIFEVTAGGRVVWRYVNPHAVVDGTERVVVNDRVTFKKRRLFKAERYGASDPALRGTELASGRAP